MANGKVPSLARVITEEGQMRLPAGFRFHPTDEEIAVHYLLPKAMNSNFSTAFIGQADFNKCEPWDLPRMTNMGGTEQFYYFQRDRKYPTGLRTNRATQAGYWKATGKDKEIYRGTGDRRELVGMKKTLVFYTERAPRGVKTNWMMHEYRLQPLISNNEEWVMSRVFLKNNTGGGAGGMDTGTCRSNSSILPVQKSDSFLTAMISDDYEILPPLVDNMHYNKCHPSSSDANGYELKDDYKCKDVEQQRASYAAFSFSQDKEFNFNEMMSNNANNFGISSEEDLHQPTLGSMPDFCSQWDY